MMPLFMPFCITSKFSTYRHKHTLTSTATILLIAAVHAVRIGITPPADRDTVSVLTLELVVVTLQITAMLEKHPWISSRAQNVILHA